MSGPDVAPVTCSDHPRIALVRRVSGRSWYPAPAEARDCPSPDHGYHRQRCARCGGPIGGRRPHVAVYCGTRCRVAAFRARRHPVTTPARAPVVTADPGTTTAGKSPAADAPKGGPA